MDISIFAQVRVLYRPPFPEPLEVRDFLCIFKVLAMCISVPYRTEIYQKSAILDHHFRPRIDQTDHTRFACDSPPKYSL